MNGILKNLLLKMLHNRIIGEKHAPEQLMIKSKVRHLDKTSQKEFYEEYEALVKKQYFIRLKKRTGKGTDWHISLNPEYVHKLEEDIL
jgi:hypothetical protein